MRHLKIFTYSLILFAPLSFANSAIQLELSNAFLSGGVHSVYGVDGEDLQGDTSSGFVMTELSLRANSSQETYLLDVNVQTGRFIMEDKRLAVAVGIRPLLGETSSTQKGKKLTIGDIAIGIHVSGDSWISKSAKLNGSISYYRTPEITSLADFKYTELLQAHVGFPVIATSEVYLGYLKLSGKPSKTALGDSFNLIDSTFLGIRLNF